MKIKIDYSSVRALRQNLPYIIGLTALCAISLFILLINIRQYQTNLSKIRSLQKEINQYNKKKDLLDFKSQIVDTQIDLDLANKALTQLIPVKEDYFSALAALERISAQTNFVITYYNIVIGNSTPEKLAIEIEGQGDPNAFLEFLKEYKFAGGRLITIDKIQFSQETFKGAKIHIYLYSGKVSNSQPSDSTNTIDLLLIEKILAKVQVQLKSEESEVHDYPTKSNPF